MTMPRSKSIMKKRAGGGAAPKKIVIKPFNKPPTLPPNYYETTSQELLEGTMNAIFNPSSQQQQALSLQNSYQQVVNLVSHQFGPRLYNDLLFTLQRACQEYVLPTNIKTAETPNLLGYIQTQYQKYVDYLLLCKHVFLPLDRTHTWVDGNVLKRTAGDSKNSPANHLGLWQVGLEQFRLRLAQFQWDDLIYQKWWDSLQSDWEGNLALDQQALLQSTLYMWQDLAVLSETLSTKLEPDLIQFFATKSQQLKQDDEKYRATSVISYCHAKWMHVAYHWSRFLPKSTCVTLLEVHLFLPHLQPEWLLHSEHFDPLLEQEPTNTTNIINTNTNTNLNRKDHPTHIQQLWILAGRLAGGYKLVAGAVSNYAKTRGLALMTGMPDSKTGKQKIAELLDLQGRLQQLLAQLPHAAEHVSLKNVWEDVVNPPMENNTNVVAEALAKYVDLYLRDAKKQVPDNNWASRIISGIFCYLQAKDIFEAFYKKDLAKRLLYNRVVSVDVERHFVSLLKAECGAGYTSKMEGMFQDMDWSRETMARYKQTLIDTTATANNDQLDMDIQVLTTGYWPVYPQYPNLILPESLKTPQEQFTNHYKTKYQGRRMTWQYALGQCLVRFKPKDNGPKYDLIVGLTQALVLLQFNNTDEMKIGQLLPLVGIEDRNEMEGVLRSLAMGKDGTRVLQKRDHDADKKNKTRHLIHDDDTFRVMDSFKSHSRRIRISNLMMKETKEEQETTIEAVSRDRLYLIDAVLVRIMKARKTILHQQLIPQVLEQVKVPAQPADIKKRIESLIEREYMERDSKDRSRYNYLA
jgi:cullin-4